MDYRIETTTSGKRIRMVQRPDQLPIKSGCAWASCIHRGPADGMVELRMCCGQTHTEPATAYRCELLDTKCVEFGTPAERNVETCAMCPDREVSPRG